MSAAAASEVTNAKDQEFLSGLWFPVADELDVDACRVTGELPEGLRGSFMRNGPNPRFEPLGRYHMFDGDGMIHSITFDEGRASYRNRWILSPQLEKEIEQGHAIWYGLSELMNFPPPEIVAEAGPVKNPANTHIIRHAGHYLALWEGGPPTEVDAQLGTVGVHDFDGKLAGGMTAHPRLDPRTGEMFFFAYSVFPPYLRYHAVDATGKLVHSIEIDIPHPIMMHDFIITEEHAIFLDSPMAFNLSGDGGPMVKWSPENGTRIGVMPRLGQADEIKWFDVPNGHVQHFWNAWVENGRIELSGTRLANPEFGMDAQEDIKDTGADAEAGRPTRYWVDLDKGTAGMEQFDDMGGDFCRINDALNGVRTRYHYMSGFFGKADVIGDFDTIVKYDDKTGQRSRWFSGETGHVGEPVFAADPSGKAEDDGWLLATLHDDATNESQILVIDARDVDAGPIARVHMPRRLPFGFHANWFAAES